MCTVHGDVLTVKGTLWAFDWGAIPIKAFGILMLGPFQSDYFHCQQSLCEAVGILTHPAYAPEVRHATNWQIQLLHFNGVGNSASFNPVWTERVDCTEHRIRKQSVKMKYAWFILFLPVIFFYRLMNKVTLWLWTKHSVDLWMLK